MKKIFPLCLPLVLALWLGNVAAAQPATDSAAHHAAARDDALRVVKSSVNAESDSAELCLEFNHPVAAMPPGPLLSALRLEQNGKSVTPQNIVLSGASLCLFPLARGQFYHLDFNTNILRAQSTYGADAAEPQKPAPPYLFSVTIPDRSPLLAFTSTSGGVSGFDAYENGLALRAVNVTHARIEVYRITDTATLAQIWQDRAQTALAPSESAYLARTKGRLAWQGDAAFATAPDIALTQKISLRDRLPDLAPGLYLITASAGGSAADPPASKGLAPLAATWFTKSDFSLQALRDSDGIHVFASTATAVKSGARLIALNRQSEQVAATRSDQNGSAIVKSDADIAAIIGMDDAGNVAFADVTPLPALKSAFAPGTVVSVDPLTLPAEAADLALSLGGANTNDASPSLIRLSRGQDSYGDFPAPPLAGGHAAFSIPAPATQGLWRMRWQKDDNTVLAEAPLRVSENADAPRLDLSADTDRLDGQAAPQVTVTARDDTGQPAVLASGRLMVAWQFRDAAALGWKQYGFGAQPAPTGAPVAAADFLTDLDGKAQLRLNLPKAPATPGLYQAAITAVADPDQGIADASPLILPRRADALVIGIKPLSEDARFFQNSLARFALIALSADEKPRDVSGLSYEIYEEGRSFDWYQDDGKWNYKREPQLRPIGGGSLSIRADGNSVLEWPVTAGTYRLEISDTNGKILAQIPFTAGWDAAAENAVSLPVALPATLPIGRDADAHFSLPEPAMVTAIIADSHMREVVHEFRPKGDNVITFTPAPDWENGVSVSIKAIAVAPDGSVSARQGAAQAALARDAAPDGTASAGGIAVIAERDPSALVLHDGDNAILTFGVENRGIAAAAFRYAFAATPGLKIEKGARGAFTLGGRQSRSLRILVSGSAIGAKELRLDVSSADKNKRAHAVRVSRAWPIAVVERADFLQDADIRTVAPRQALIPPAAVKERNAEIAFIAPRPMPGLGAMLTYVVNAHPFTTRELALGIDALRAWNGTLTQAGVAPAFATAARRHEWFVRLLQHQNADGGFSALRGGASALRDTALALVALGADASPTAQTARERAVAWIKQKLSNNWFDEKERGDRAAAYAGLAAADAVDAASLHYFSDTSATVALPAQADADMAAAFTHIGDQGAASFWIRKIPADTNRAGDFALLNALAATGALSSDDVQTAMRALAASLRRGDDPGFGAAAGVLCAAAADIASAGTWHMATGRQTRDMTGVYAAPLSDPALTSLRNSDAQPLSVVIARKSLMPSFAPPQGAAIIRHIYRLNGVALSPQATPAYGEPYIVELTGTVPDVKPGEHVVLYDGVALRPIGCALPAGLDTLSFIPWFTSRDLSPITDCEMSSDGLNTVLAGTGGDGKKFRMVYFAFIDTVSAGALVPARMRILGPGE